MPLTKDLRKIKRHFELEYGKRLGGRYFYGWERKHYPWKFKLTKKL